MTPCSPLKISLFPKNILPPSSGSKSKPSKKQHEAGSKLCSGGCFSKTSAEFHWTIQLHIPVDLTLHSHWFKNLKSNEPRINKKMHNSNRNLNIMYTYIVLATRVFQIIFQQVPTNDSEI
jgi:hypothetical protein